MARRTIIEEAEAFLAHAQHRVAGNADDEAALTALQSISAQNFTLADPVFDPASVNYNSFNTVGFRMSEESRVFDSIDPDTSRLHSLIPGSTICASDESLPANRSLRPIDLQSSDIAAPPNEVAGEGSSFYTDNSDSGSDLLPFPSFLERYRPALAVRLLISFVHYRRQITSASSPGSQRGSGAEPEFSGNIDQASSGTPSSLGKSLLKRRGRDGSPPDEDEQHSKQRRTNFTTKEEDSRLLACPYRKYNPRRYRMCQKYILREISRLKQHLNRCHRIPIHCPLCSEIFISVLDRDEHLRERSCIVLPPNNWDGVNESQETQLQQRISSKKTKEDNWYIIYDILFPGAPRPRSPYIDAYLSDEILAFQEFAMTAGPNIVNEVVQSVLADSLRPQSDEVQAFSQILFRDGLSLLLERWEASRNLRTTSTASLSSNNSLNRSDFSDFAHGSAIADSGSNSQAVAAVGGAETTESQVLACESGPSGADVPFDNSTGLFAMVITQSAGLEGLSVFEAQLDLDDYIRSLPLEEYEVEEIEGGTTVIART